MQRRVVKQIDTASCPEIGPGADARPNATVFMM